MKKLPISTIPSSVIGIGMILGGRALDNDSAAPHVGAGLVTFIGIIIASLALVPLTAYIVDRATGERTVQ